MIKRCCICGNHFEPPDCDKCTLSELRNCPACVEELRHLKKNAQDIRKRILRHIKVLSRYIDKADPNCDPGSK